MAAVGLGWATGQSVRYLRGGGCIHYTYNLAVGEGKGVARAHKTKQAGGGGVATFHTNIAQFLLGFTAF